MRKSIFILIIPFFISCSKKEVVQEIANTNVEQPKIVTDPINEGKSLVEGADCLGCHKLDEKMTGPSYKEVANKYDNTPENIDLLAQRIIDGSSGIWGEIPMPAHNGLSKENARFMAQYIMAQKK